MAADAVHPDEIAAILESDGMTDDHIRLTYGRDDSFALAEDLYARVERRHAEPEAPPAGPWHSGLAGCLLRGLVFALPGLAYVLGAPLLAGPAAGPLLAGAVTGWVWNQALAHRAYSWLGLGDRRASARALLVGAPAGALVGTAVALAAAGPGAWRVVVFAAGQSLYLGAATALLVLGRERALLCALVPLAGAVPAFRYDLPDPLRAGLLLLSLTATVSFATIVLRPGAWAGRSDSAATPAPRAAGSEGRVASAPRSGRTDRAERASAPWARWPGRAMTPAPRSGGSAGVVPPDLRSGGSAGVVAPDTRAGRSAGVVAPGPRPGRTDRAERVSAPWARWPGRAMTPAPRDGRSGRIADPAPQAGRSCRVVDPAPRVRRAGRVERGSGSGRSGPPLVGSLPYGLFGLGTGLLVLYAGGGDVLVTGAAPVVALTLSMGPAEWLLHRFRSESLVGLRTLTSARAFRRAAAGTLAHCLGAYLAVLLALASLGTLLSPGAPALGGVRLLGLLLVGVVLWLGLLLQAFGAVRSAAAVCTLAAAAQTFTPAAGPAVAGAAAAVLAVLACALLVRPTAHRV
ncbi:hypothetical protein ABZX98_12990 [Streptomyces sp. NPDC002992]|uniref:hypothetical protein n=1 Tax=Streptomyces sp. NPDC002992 TaxID=3154273 RepID=UPI0033A7EE55